MTEEKDESPFIEEMGDEPITSAAPAPSNPPVDGTARYEGEVRFLLFRLEKTEAAFLDFKKRTGKLMLALLMFVCIGGAMLFLMAKRTGDQITDVKDLLAAATKNNSLKISSISFSHWEQGQEPVQLIKSTDGLCVLTKVTGHFEGGGESVKLWIGQDGYWYLGGESHQQGIGADCAVLRF